MCFFHFSRLPPFGIPLTRQQSLQWFVLRCRAKEMQRESVENNKSNTAKMSARPSPWCGAPHLFHSRLCFLHIFVHMYDSKYSRDSSPAMIFDLVCFALVRAMYVESTHERTCLRCAFSTHTAHRGLAPHAAQPYSLVDERKPYRLDVFYGESLRYFGFGSIALLPQHITTQILRIVRGAEENKQEKKRKKCELKETLNFIVSFVGN